MSLPWLTFIGSVLMQGLIGLAVLFKIGKYVGRSEERQDAVEKRVEHLESAKCPHQECPLRLDIQMRQVFEKGQQG